MTNFLDELNQPQQHAVQAVDGPVMVIAGAGSGKTRVLTYRIAYLLSIGAEPFNLLALTFTNKAAREMKERIGKLVGESRAKSLWMGTFHSIFARVLRVESEKLGFPRNFTIYDTDDSKRLIKKIVKEQNLDDKTYNPGYVMSRISGAKNNLISPIDYNEDFEIQNADTQARKPKLGLLYSLYQQRLKTASAMDFDDLLFNTNVLLRDFPEVLYKYQQKFHYILVDEYQDTNFSQYLIVKKLAANNENICVVGDDAQSIYAFRGANIANILNFRSDYPEHKMFKLEQNYRSSQNIVKAANSVIKHNKNQIFKEIWTSNPIGDKVQVYKAANEGDEASWIAARIFEWRMQHQLPNSDFAILYRTNSQSRALEEALRKMNIPYRIYGGVSFYQRKEIKDVLAYFRLIINPNDEDAFMRVVNFPQRGIGDASLDKLVVAANENKISLWDAACSASKLKPGLSQGVLNRLDEFTTMIKSFAAQLFKHNAYEMGELVLNKAGIRKFYFEDDSPESINRKENIEELLSGLKDFVMAPADADEGNDFKTLDEFMEDVALLTDADTNTGDPNLKNTVSLMTIHAAKGLEFPYVFVAGSEENLFPSQMSIGSRAELEEERRLFYVAITRAMKKATLTWAETRFRFGSFNFCEPSRFIDELDQDFVTHLTGKEPKTARTQPRESFSDSLKNFKRVSQLNNQPTTPIPVNEEGFSILTGSQVRPGMSVIHQKFGQGNIVEVEGNGANVKITVVFDGLGKKQLILKFARLKIV